MQELYDDPASSEEEDQTPTRQMPLGIVIARIFVVTVMSFAAAFAIFFFVGGLWLIGLACAAITGLFLVAMFAIERGAEHTKL